ncbi:MAG TPA: DUF2934 domain-containing protein [Phycisphaerae bacterium]|nr:DUF2934 domain-containing protein [Phycisphaerae bacterium]
MAKQTTRKSPTAARSTASKATTSTTGVTKSCTKPMPSEEQIRARAFEIFKRRNGGPGDAHSDWLQAERELQEELSR